MSTRQGSESADILVTAVANIVLNRHLYLLKRAALRPLTVDVLPLALANAYWLWRKSRIDTGSTGIALHIGSDITTVIIDGPRSMFYNRLIYFAAREMYGPQKDANLTPGEFKRRITVMSDEIVQSLSFYQNQYKPEEFAPVALFGTLFDGSLIEAIREKTGMEVVTLNLTNTISPEVQCKPGAFDIAVALAMRELSS
jgi:hypothetical protein